MTDAIKLTNAERMELTRRAYSRTNRADDARRARLHVPNGNRLEIPEPLKDVVLADILIEGIENGWTEFSAACDAVAAGRISAVLACERFGSESRGEMAHKAGYAYGPVTSHAASVRCADAGRVSA
jgi:hypothetical protein